MTPQNRAEVERIRELDAKRTPELWTYVKEEMSSRELTLIFHTVRKAGAIDHLGNIARLPNEAEAAFIAAAPEMAALIARLAEQLERAEKDAERFRAILGILDVRKFLKDLFGVRSGMWPEETDKRLRKAIDKIITKEPT